MKLSMCAVIAGAQVAEEVFLLSRVVRSFATEEREAGRYRACLAMLRRISIRQAAAYLLYLVTNATLFNLTKVPPLVPHICPTYFCHAAAAVRQGCATCTYVVTMQRCYEARTLLPSTAGNPYPASLESNSHFPAHLKLGTTWYCRSRVSSAMARCGVEPEPRWGLAPSAYQQGRSGFARIRLPAPDRQVLSLMVGGGMALAGRISPEQLTTFVLYVEFVTAASLSVCDQWGGIMESIGASERVMVRRCRLIRLKEPCMHAYMHRGVHRRQQARLDAPDQAKGPACISRTGGRVCNPGER